MFNLLETDTGGPFVVVFDPAVVVIVVVVVVDEAI